MTIALNNSFEVPTAVGDTWRTLLDVERVAMCLPGAQLDSMDGDTFTGRVKVKLGPIAMSFKGSAEFVERDETTHRAVLAASGREIAGSGTASAVMTMQVVESTSGSGSTVNIGTDLAITGKAAKFGRGVIPDVAGKLVGQFATALTAELVQSTEPDLPSDRPASEERRGTDAPPVPEAFQVLGADGAGIVAGQLMRVTSGRLLVAAALTAAWLLGRLRGAQSSSAGAHPSGDRHG